MDNEFTRNEAMARQQGAISAMQGPVPRPAKAETRLDGITGRYHSQAEALRGLNARLGDIMARLVGDASTASDRGGNPVAGTLSSLEDAGERIDEELQNYAALLDSLDTLI